MFLNENWFIHMYLLISNVHYINVLFNVYNRYYYKDKTGCREKTWI